MKIKYFIGFRLVSELRSPSEHLKKMGFTEIINEESSYLGLFLSKDQPDITDIEKGFLDVEEKLAPYRAEIPKRLTTLKLISQLMIG